MSGRRLIGDIGGTNARFAIAEGGKYRQLKHIEVDKYPSLRDAISDYLTALPEDERSGLAGALAIAGPVLGDRIALTNQSWSFSIAELKQSLGLVSLAVVNDFAATAQSIPHLAAQQKFAIGPMIPNAKGNIGVVGPGTGLGMSSLIPSGDGWTLVAGEGGHATLAASTEEEFAIIQMLRKRWSHVSAERVLSGAGLVNLYEALCAIGGIEPLMLSPADVTRRAMDRSDETCVRAFAHFCGFLGSVAGDLALTVGAFGGVYIAGGILPRFKDAFAASKFRERFEAKGRFSKMLAGMPTWLILDENPGLIGLANMPLNQSEPKVR
ncbi:MAG TPA: glucokinase [Bradyrhizobium sp.]|uniref:glucokinase n=1 Tax=Bradyrhizobium sp. TaxID=376 RepID=UPI002B9D79B3|nr:glucokinase [Bradyrhizobium sp.]HLZ04459.1 glucokinase [Bradyrhizobium sp.]